MIKIIIAFVAGFLIASIGLSGIANFVDNKVVEIQESIK